MKKVLIAGGSGFVGTRLQEMLLGKGYEVAILTRKKNEQQAAKSFTWDVRRGWIDPQAMQFADVVINLSGAGVADHRWTEAYKQELYDSRILTTRLLVEKMKEVHVQKFICASAIGIYGNQLKHTAIESDAPGSGFLAKLCVDWEQAAMKAVEQGVLTTMIRTGIVLGKNGGFVKESGRFIKKYLGAAFGNGNQIVSWIHLDDLCHMYLEAIVNTDFQGAFNAVSPHPVSNNELTHKLASHLHKPVLLPPVPGFVLRVVMGEMTDSLLADQPVSALKALEHGFVFKFPYVDEALREVTGQ